VYNLEYDQHNSHTGNFKMDHTLKKSICLFDFDISSGWLSFLW